MHEGVASARDRLAGSQYRLIFKIAQKFAGTVQRPDLVEDFFQDGVAALVQALDGFDPEKGALSTFSVTVARRAMLRFFREDPVELAEDVLKARRGKRGGRRASSQAEGAAAPPESDAVSRLAGASDPEADLVARLTVLLSDDEAAILEWLLEGKPQKEMAKSLGICTRTVRRKRDSAKGKLRAYVQRFGTYATPAA
jgi:RNA polymerase sigma factor (sigma-70 family)